MVPVYKHTQKLEHSAVFVELRWSRAAEYLLLEHVVPEANTAGFPTIIICITGLCALCQIS